MRKLFIKSFAFICVCALMAGCGSKAEEPVVSETVSISETQMAEEVVTEDVNNVAASVEALVEEEKEEVKEEVKEETKEEEPIEIDKTWEYPSDIDISWIDVEKPMVALSFDDGPVAPVNDNSSAIRIQNALADGGMHATFFYWGLSLNDDTRKEIERAHELGFELGNHTRTHPDLTKLSEEEIEKEVAYMDKELGKIAAQEHFLVRPPYLAVNDKVKETIFQPLITCEIDTKDWDNASAQDIIDVIVRACEKGTLNGTIVLMHETYDTTAEAMEYLVPYLKDAGYQIVSISELYCARSKVMKGGKVYAKCAK